MRATPLLLCARTIRIDAGIDQCRLQLLSLCDEVRARDNSDSGPSRSQGLLTPATGRSIGGFFWLHCLRQSESNVSEPKHAEARGSGRSVGIAARLAVLIDRLEVSFGVVNVLTQACTYASYKRTSIYVVVVKRSKC